MSTYYFEESQYLREFFYVVEKVPLSYRQLYSDPYSLRISRPQLPNCYLRSLLQPQLKRICRNLVFRELIYAAESDMSRIIIAALDSANVLRAKVLSCLYNASPQALLDYFLRKFESGKSVLDFVLIRRNQRSVNKLLSLKTRRTFTKMEIPYSHT